MKTADIVIIGGGIFGANLAYALAKAGTKNVLLLEQGVLAGGSSSKATGGLRQQFADDVDICFSIEGIRFYESFSREYTPTETHLRPPPFYQHGYMFLCSTLQSWRNMQIYVERQRRQNVPTQLLSPDEIKQQVPQLIVDDLIGGTFCPTDGYSDPGAMARALAYAARDKGVTIQEQTPVTAITLKRGRVQGVTTPQDTIASPIVVNAAGVYASLVARLAGIKDLPVWPLKRQLYQTEDFEDLPAKVPMVVDVSTGFHFRRKEEGVVLTMPLPVSDEQIYRNKLLKPEAFTLNVEENLWPLIQAQIKHRCPALAQAKIRRAWAGFYEMTPDEHPILGETEVKGFLCGCGFSGHGFMHSPKAARLLAESILGNKHATAEMKMFRLERFKKGRLIHTTHLL